jgi:hypothetical protein
LIAEICPIARTFLIAEAEIAGPSPVSLPKPSRYQRGYCQPVPDDHALKKITQM